MKAIIDNKLYNTETAEIIYTFRGNEPQSVLWSNKLKLNCWREKDIYKTKRGNYFIHIHEGGINTSVSFSDLKERIELISEDKVKEIIRKLNIEKYIKLFGKVEEG